MKKKSKIVVGLLSVLIICLLLIPGCIEKPGIEWGIGVYPPHGFTNPNLDDWDDAFAKSRTVGKIAHLEVTYGEMNLTDAEFLYDIKGHYHLIHFSSYTKLRDIDWRQRTPAFYAYKDVIEEVNGAFTIANHEAFE